MQVPLADVHLPHLAREELRPLHRVAEARRAMALEVKVRGALDSIL